jgi:hypothetical protein
MRAKGSGSYAPEAYAGIETETPNRYVSCVQ